MQALVRLGAGEEGSRCGGRGLSLSSLNRKTQTKSVAPVALSESRSCPWFVLQWKGGVSQLLLR